MATMGLWQYIAITLLVSLKSGWCRKPLSGYKEPSYSGFPQAVELDLMKNLSLCSSIQEEFGLDTTHLCSTYHF